LTYTVTVTNIGPNTATSVVITDTLPTSVTFVSASSPCTNIAGVVTCNLGTLNSAGKTNVTIVVTTTISGSITNTAEVSSAVLDLVTNNNTAVAVTTVNPAHADLAVSKTDSPDPVGAGSNLTYTVTVTNIGPNTATSVMLADTLPTSVTFVSASSGCSELEGVVTCDLGTLNSHTKTNVTIVVTTTTSGSITNIAEVSSAVLDLVTNNNTAVAVTTVNPNTDLAVSKTDSPDPVGVGSNLTYTVTVTNIGPDIATGVVLVDTLPQNVDFVSASSGCGNIAGVIICNLGTLNSGAKTNVTIVVTPLAAGSITNAAQVSSAGPDLVTNNNTTVAVTTVNPAPQNADLVVRKRASPQLIGVGNNLTYTVTVTNGGPDTATGVFLVDVLPENVNFVSTSSACDELAGVVTCDLGTLNSGARTNVTIVVTTTTTGLITNTADVISDVNDTDLSNNTAMQITSVSTGACSGIDLTGAFSNVVATCKLANGKVKGKIIVQNLGTQDAPTSFVKFYVSDDDQFDDPALGGNDSLLKQVATGTVKLGKPKIKTLSVNMRGECFTGKFIIAVIDAGHTVAECNEDNNVIIFGPLP
jgi:uncharacterized repeat protein (TIGR01451 family)